MYLFTLQLSTKTVLFLESQHILTMNVWSILYFSEAEQHEINRTNADIADKVKS